MKHLRYFFAIAASALMMVACQKDVDIDNELALNGSLKLRFDVPTLEVVDITRGAVEETEAYNVMVYIFDADGKLHKAEEINLTPTNENSYSRKYEVDTQIGLTSGQTYDIYAIANTKSNSLWTEVAKFDAAAKEGIEKFKAVALTLTTVENPSSRMTLSGHTTFSATGSTALAVDIQLSRPYAKVTFNVKSGSTNPNFSFTPTSYSIYNVPTEASMFEGTSLSGNYKNYESRAIGLSGTFEFIQMENAFNIVSGPTKYTDREKRVSDTDRTFAYAPATSTYVVIYGEAVEKNENDVVVMSAKTNYTIHLGDFSPSGDYGDFSVNRNTHYTYNVTVNGVNMIEVEAKKENADYENGAEGTIIDMTASKQVFNLDAHYETVLLKLDITNIEFGGDDSQLNSLTLSVSTPMMEDANKNKTVYWEEIKAAVDGGKLDDFYKKYDAQWVEFLPVANNAFAAYPKDKAGLLDICTLMNEIYKEKTAPAANNVLTVVKQGNVEYIYVVAFVNEYYYEGQSWSKFVNKPDREMKILQSPEVSADGHSVYSEALCAFQQKSISTMFDPSSTANVFGIEMYDETGLLGINDDRGDDSKTNGWANMKSYFTGNWTTYVKNNGYTYEGQPNGNSYNNLQNSYNNGAYACAQRNRDLDGDGAIDDDELRWYMPALDQYCAFWYGEEALPTAARLFQGLTTDVKSGAEHNDLNHYYTSTTGNYRIFWAIEGSSHSSFTGNNYIADTHNTRCVRNLKSVTEAPAEATSRSGYYISVNNFVETAYRTTTQNGQYPQHHEREIPNKLPHSFKVASANLDDDHLAAGGITTLNYTIKAPAISSAVGRNGQTILTFADVVTDGSVGYYYTTTNSASQTNRLVISSHQAAIDGIELSASGSFEKQNVTISNAAYQNSTLTLTLSAALPTGVTLYYATAPNGTKTQATRSTNTQYTCGNNPNVYVWLSADGKFSDSYATVTTATTTVDQNVTISDAAYQNNTLSLNLSAALPTDVTLHYATTPTGTKTHATRATNTRYTCGNNPNVYVWLSADGGQTFSDSYATVTTTTETTTATQTVTISSATRQGNGQNRYYRITLSEALPSGVTLYYRQGSETGQKNTASRNGNSTIQYNLGSSSNNYNPTYVWISGDGGATYSESIRVSGTNTITFPDGKELSIAVTTEATKTSVTNEALKIGVPQSSTSVADGALSINVPANQTYIYLWAYDQAVREFSNPTIVSASSVQIGEDKVITETLTTKKSNTIDINDNKKFNSKRDKLRLAATTMDLCAGYSETGDPENAPKWRVPNQRELTIMNLHSADLGLNTGTYGYFSSTKFSNAVNATLDGNLRYSYVIEKGGLLALVIQSLDYAIRCVRDLAPGEAGSPSDIYDGYYDTDGDGQLTE